MTFGEKVDLFSCIFSF